LAEKTAALMERTISYIDCDDFRQCSAEELLAEPRLTLAPGENGVQPPPDTPPYLASLYEFPLLTRDQEYQIFRKMHYLLSLAAEAQEELTLSSLSSRTVHRIEMLLRQANDVRNRIVQCNLRLVVSIAKNMVDSANSLDDLISDGNLPLIRAAEIFDYTRGLRFSTYATWAVRNGLFRSSKRSRRLHSRLKLDEFDSLQHSATTPPEEPDFGEEWGPRELEQLVNRLDPRSQAIIRDRFGLTGTERPARFRELASKLRLSSERVRQLLERALAQLREMSGEVVAP
jgi:RNA polymerase primary sigma factor/RNA polymerase sigma factor